MNENVTWTVGNDLPLQLVVLFIKLAGLSNCTFPVIQYTACQCTVYTEEKHISLCGNDRVKAEMIFF